MRKYVLCLSICFLLVGCTSTSDDSETTSTDVGQSEPLESIEDVRVSFLAVGDNLIHNTVYLDPYKKQGDTWNYDAIYEPLKPYLEGVDVKQVNQETPLGGRALGLSNYPMFNGPQEIGDALVHAGFNWITQASNHAIDAGEAGILSQMNFWDNYQDSVITTGMNRSQEEANTPRILEVKGMKIGLLNYTYGLNGLMMPEGKEYLVNLIDEDKIKADIASLNGKCDTVIASMHWGNEYQFVENDEQKALAQLLSDEGVSVIIGAHPHVIEPMEFISGKNGNKTLVMYSLGNLISSQDVNYAMLGGMAKWELVKDGSTKQIRVEKAQFYPVVTHFIANMQEFKTYALKDYTDELANTHYLHDDISKDYFIDLCNEIMGQPEDIEIIY